MKACTCVQCIVLVCAMFAPSSVIAASVPKAANLDALTFGDQASESAHAFVDAGSNVVVTGPGTPARALAPQNPASWQGGSMSFKLKVDPVKQNYFTAKFWGGESNPNRLILFCQGKQIGYRPIGDIPTLDFGNDSPDAPCPGKWYYQTSPLPISMTTGRVELSFEIRSTGRIWVYGTTFEQFQKQMTQPSRAIYAAYIHTDSYFSPSADSLASASSLGAKLRASPGPEVFDHLKSRVNAEVDKLLASVQPLNELEFDFLARAYGVKWTNAYDNANAVTAVERGMDALFVAYRNDPAVMTKNTYGSSPDWACFGPAGHAYWLLADKLRPTLDDKIADEMGQPIARRDAWASLFAGSVDYSRQHRRFYTNQTMIVDLNCALANRALADIEPSKALAPDHVSSFLYQSVGLEPWQGSDTPSGPELPFGKDYWEITPSGLTKELGYVGYYGEVLNWLTSIYNATRPTPDKPGDPRILAQIVKIARARAVFRYPAVDGDGYRAMRIETIVGWRDTHYPGDVAYAERATSDASPLYFAATTLDPVIVGYTKQMFADDQVFRAIDAQVTSDGGLQGTSALLDIPEDFDVLNASTLPAKQLPMAASGDFVWADEDDGVVAIKQGDDILYASLYWYALRGVNHLARIHLITPKTEEIAVAAEDEDFEPSGMVFVRPDLINLGFNNGLYLKYPGDLHSAEAGEQLPIAKIPDGVKFKPGDDCPFAGRASFYELRYGRYLIGMNSTRDQTYQLTVAPGVMFAKDLNGGRVYSAGQSISVGPLQTVVLSQ